jgi:hypothetical protein
MRRLYRCVPSYAASLELDLATGAAPSRAWSAKDLLTADANTTPLRNARRHVRACFWFMSRRYHSSIAHPLPCAERRRRTSTRSRPVNANMSDKPPIRPRRQSSTTHAQMPVEARSAAAPSIRHCSVSALWTVASMVVPWGPVGAAGARRNVETRGATSEDRVYAKEGRAVSPILNGSSSCISE